MKSKLLIILFLVIACFSSVQAQNNINNMSPKDYTIGGVTVSGVKFLNKQALVQISGLKVGKKIKIPGDEIARSIEKLWKQGLFSDVSISITSITPDDQVFLDIKLEERPKLSKVEIKGIRKGEIDDIKEKIKLVPGTKVTEHVITNTKNIIEKHFYEKGYYNVDVRITQNVDTMMQNVVRLIVNVDKGNKVKIKEIIPEGNVNFSDKKVRQGLKQTKQKRWYGMFKPSKFIRTKFEEDKETLIKKFNEFGYRDAQVLGDSVYKIDDKTVGVKIKVEEGKQYYFRSITWVGNTKYPSDKLQRNLDIKKGDLYDQNRLDDRLNNDQDAVGNLYLDDGYLFYRSIPREISVINDSIDVEIIISEGPQAHIDRIGISGNTRTNDHVARRELYTIPGELFSRTDIINSVRELAQLGNFEPEKLVPNVEPDANNSTVDINYSLTEKSNDQFELSAGWGGGSFVGRLGVTFNNFSTKNFFDKSSWRPLPGGDGQKLSLAFQSNGKYYQTYSLSFVEPWLGGRRRNSLTVSFYYTDVNYLNYSSYYNYRMQVIGGAVGFGRRLSWPDNYFQLYEELEYKRYKLNNYPYFEGFDADGIANEVALKTVFSRNSIDAPIYSRRGSSFSLSLEITPPYSKFNNKDYRSLSDSVKWEWVEYHKWGFEAKTFTPLTKDLVLHTKIEAGISGFFTRDLGYSPFQGFTMGGDGMNYYTYGKDVVGLRGYDSESISDGGNAYVKYAVEIRYPITLSESASIYALGFAEGGNCWKEINQLKPFDVYRSAGLGVRIFMPMLGMLGLDWGWGFDTVPGENKPSGSKFQFTMGQNF
ncbi:MAG: outer membrane protein assembly factor BamA [Bacteroidales bacterium]|nr:outer membrane protein assembly factor BamA [Bacteroidales bacterium]